MSSEYLALRMWCIMKLTVTAMVTPYAILYPTLGCRPPLFWFSCKWRYINACLLLLLLLTEI